jgi:hypothetical protein
MKRRKHPMTTMHVDMVKWEEFRAAMRACRRPRVPEPERPAPARQKVLFSGVDCLPGQQDLFATDGKGEPKST